ncbi:MAG: PAS domain S-box protein, partial [Chitinophagaceae bacterium]
MGFTVLVKDISIQKHLEAVQLKQKDLERQHAESRSVFEAFMQNSPLVGWVTDDKGIMRYMNALYLETYGFTKADFDRSIFDIFPNQIAVDYYRNNLEVIKKNEAVEIVEKGIMADGKEQILKIYKFPLSINGATLVAGWAVDITEQTVLQEQFSRSVERYESANQATSDAIYDWDTTTDIITKNSNFEAMFGYQETTVCISKRMQRIHPDDRERVRETYFSSLANPSTEKWNINYRFLSADGKYKYVIDKAVIKREHHKAVRVIGALQDITVLKEMEQKIIDHEKSRKREVVRSIIEAQEKERRKLSVELHDNVNQMLSSCKLMLEVALDDEANAPMLTEKSYQCIQAVMIEIRKISHELNPSALQDVGLTEAISEMIDKINLTKKLTIAFNYTEEAKLFVTKEEDRIAIYRIIQEAISNVIKHAYAKNAS